MSGEGTLLTASSKSIACSREVAVAVVVMDARELWWGSIPFDFPSLRRQDADLASLDDNDKSYGQSAVPGLRDGIHLPRLF